MSKFSKFQQEVGEWGDQTFNHKRGNNSKAIVHHLIKEVAELLYSNSPEEAADCFLLLLHHAHTLGYDLLDEARKKMVVNKERQWGLPDENGVVEHIREDGHVEFEKGVAEVTLVPTKQFNALVEATTALITNWKNMLTDLDEYYQVKQALEQFKEQP